ncbi:spore germination protein [Clostridium pasteurianum]|uniref:Spore germination protein, GerA family n=1 Tax=Clostridium pasteurianum BC1 TaxID=86416 RepID=R4K6V6_CLOPA|nr:spore germination protein [Clostridium pasteurianum]AGK98293.1 spore germination protein, GerA family [Clostridium pasteurianum BC1]
MANEEFDYKNIQVSVKLNKNVENIKKILDKFPDLIMREIKIANNPKHGAVFFYINKMVNINIMEEVVIKKLISRNEYSPYDISNPEYFKYILGINDKDILSSMDKIINKILDGKVVLFIDEIDKAIVIDLKNIPSRNIEEPVVETVIRGPREGFTENISTDIVLIREKIKSPNLKIEQFILGRETKTDVAIMYLSNIVNIKIVNELKERINQIDVDALFVTNTIKEYIEDDPITKFPTIFSTERPDVIVAKLLGGRIAIFANGTPVVLTVPAIFTEFLISTEDFYVSYIYATFNRYIRYLGFAFSILLPGLFVAIITFHQEVIPTSLLISLIKARSAVPYSSLFESFLMLTVYELVREAGVRMPRAVGQAISTVGALILGQAAVQAGLASTAMVIVIATTSIAAFTIPSTNMYTATILPRFIFLFLGGSLGLLGLITGVIIFLLKLISIRSFGVPYMEPLAPFVKSEFGDLIMRRPIWSKTKRSSIITGKKSKKRKSFNPIEKKFKEKNRE